MFQITRCQVLELHYFKHYKDSHRAQSIKEKCVPGHAMKTYRNGGTAAPFLVHLTRWVADGVLCTELQGYIYVERLLGLQKKQYSYGNGMGGYRPTAVESNEAERPPWRHGEAEMPPWRHDEADTAL